MSFCTFSKEFSQNNTTSIDNKFINSYLPEATGDAVKVYLYGLYVCSDDEENSLEKFSKDVNLPQETVIDCFRFWEEFGLVNIISAEPFMVKYLPINAKPKKINPEKYTEFNKALQVIIPDRMITVSEYSAYFSLMEECSIKPEAMLMIVKYCVDLKGTNVGFRYIIKVANDFVARGVTSVAKIEKELNDYTIRSGELGEIMNVVCPNKKPELEDTDYYKKWTKEFSFDKESIIFTALQAKCKTMAKLDKELFALFSAKKFSTAEIKDYYGDKNRLTGLAVKIDKALSVYVQVIDPVVNNYVSPWLSKGYDEETLLFIANSCFRQNMRSLDKMDETIDKLYKKGLVTLPSILEYFKAANEDDEFIKEIISTVGLSRRPTDWDRENLKTWRSWNFSDEMILEAAKISVGKNLPYINAVLSAWKADGVYSPNRIPPQSGAAKSNAAIRTRSYTKEELDSLIVNFEDMEF